MDMDYRVAEMLHQKATSPKLPSQRRRRKKRDPVMGTFRPTIPGGPAMYPLPPRSERPAIVTPSRLGSRPANSFRIDWGQKLRIDGLKWCKAFAAYREGSPHTFDQRRGPGYMVLAYGFHTTAVRLLERAYDLPGVLTYHGYQDYGPHRYIIMDRYHSTLDERLETKSILTRAAVTSIIRSMLTTITNLHNADVYFQLWFTSHWAVQYPSPEPQWSARIVYIGFLMEEELHQLDDPDYAGVYLGTDRVAATSLLAAMSAILMYRFVRVLPPSPDQYATEFESHLYDLLDTEIFNVGAAVREYFGKYDNSEESVKFFLRCINSAIMNFSQKWPRRLFKDEFLRKVIVIDD